MNSSYAHFLWILFSLFSCLNKSTPSNPPCKPLIDTLNFSALPSSITNLVSAAVYEDKLMLNCWDYQLSLNTVKIKYFIYNRADKTSYYINDLLPKKYQNDYFPINGVDMEHNKLYILILPNYLLTYDLNFNLIQETFLAIPQDFHIIFNGLFQVREGFVYLSLINSNVSFHSSGIFCSKEDVLLSCFKLNGHFENYISPFLISNCGKGGFKDIIDISMSYFADRITIINSLDSSRIITNHRLEIFKYTHLASNDFKYWNTGILYRNPQGLTELPNQGISINVTKSGIEGLFKTALTKDSSFVYFNCQNDGQCTSFRKLPIDFGWHYIARKDAKDNLLFFKNMNTYLLLHQFCL